MNLKTKILTDEPVRLMDVYNEFNTNVAEKNKINSFRSRVGGQWFVQNVVLLEMANNAGNISPDV
jgi:hypothetical protein